MYILGSVITGRDRRGRDRMVVGFTTYTISAYHHYRSEFESCTGEVCSIQHYVIKFFSYLRQVGGFLQVLRFISSETLFCSKSKYSFHEEQYVFKN